MSASCSPICARDGADRVDARETGFGRFRKDVAGDAGVVVHRRRVRHAGHRREAAGHGRRGSRRDGFLRALARLPQMDMQIDQAGADDHAVHIKPFDVRRSFGTGILANDSDLAIAQEQIGRSVKILARIDDAATGKEQGTHSRGGYTDVN